VEKRTPVARWKIKRPTGIAGEIAGRTEGADWRKSAWPGCRLLGKAYDPFVLNADPKKDLKCKTYCLQPI